LAFVVHHKAIKVTLLNGSETRLMKEPKKLNPKSKQKGISKGLVDPKLDVFGFILIAQR
jgi:hypothetical protein